MKTVTTLIIDLIQLKYSVEYILRNTNSNQQSVYKAVYYTVSELKAAN